MESNEKTSTDGSESVRIQPTTEQEPRSPYTMFRVLSAPTRAKLLAYLTEQSNPVTVAELADVLVTADFQNTNGATDRERKTVYSELYHVHLPKLNEAGLVNIESDEEEITLLIPPSQLKPYLDLVDSPTL
jgi:DNA-binding transcriptional ArsR family regulator